VVKRKPKVSERIERSLAYEPMLSRMFSALIFMGEMCPKCGHGTRVTSKRWAKCKKCGERVERRGLPELPT